MARLVWPVMHSAGTPRAAKSSVMLSAWRTVFAKTIARAFGVCSNHAATGSIASAPSIGASGATTSHGTR